MTNDEERWLAIGKATERIVLKAIAAQHDGEVAMDVTDVVIEQRGAQGLSSDGPSEESE